MCCERFDFVEQLLAPGLERVGSIPAVCGSVDLLSGMMVGPLRSNRMRSWGASFGQSKTFRSIIAYLPVLRWSKHLAEQFRCNMMGHHHETKYFPGPAGSHRSRRAGWMCRRALRDISVLRLRYDQSRVGRLLQLSRIRVSLLRRLFHRLRRRIRTLSPSP
jgi:hypothetical protein